MHRNGSSALPRDRLRILCANEGKVARGATRCGTGDRVRPRHSEAKHFVFAGYRESRLTVQGTHGFAITVSHINHRIELTASKGHVAAIYILPATSPSLHETRARFPGVGRVFVRFRSSGPPRRSPPFFHECRGGGEFEQKGTFSGKIEFHGEHDFTRVAVTSAPGVINRSAREVCPPGNDDSGSPLSRGYSLLAYARSHQRTIQFGALRTTEESVIHGDTTYFASASEKRRGMTIARVAIAKGNPNTFAVAGPLTRPDSATVSPPPPLQGHRDLPRHGGRAGRMDGNACDRPARSARTEARRALILLVALPHPALHRSSATQVATALTTLRSGQRLPVPGLRRG